MRTLKPDLMLLDEQLIGNISGWDLLQSIRQEPNLQDLAVVMMSENEPVLEKSSGFKTGANDYLLKPIRIRQLETILKRYLK